MAVIVAGYFGINPPGFVAQVVAFAFGLAASSFFPLIIMGIFWKRATKEGAILGMICGILFTAAYIIYFKFVNPDANVAANWLWGISPEGIGTIGMALNFIVMYVVSLITPAPPQEVQDMVESIRFPRTMKSSRRKDSLLSVKGFPRPGVGRKTLPETGDSPPCFIPIR